VPIGESTKDGFHANADTQTLDRIVSLHRSWWLQYLIEFAKLALKR
jgi:hypothetical protein